jgi:hypothetical protein
MVMEDVNTSSTANPSTGARAESETSGARDSGRNAPASEFQVAKLSKAELIARITGLAGQLNAANYHWLVLIAEFDRRHAWSDGGLTKSCAHWLSWKCGLDLRAAREKVRVAAALVKLPTISAAMEQGRLSYSKVRALTRVATEATEEVLLNVALYGTTEHVEELVRRFRQVQEVQELSRVERQYAHRGFTHFYDQDGSLVVKLRLPAEAGALLLKAIEIALPDIPLPGQAPPHARVSAESSSASVGANSAYGNSRADTGGSCAHGPGAASGDFQDALQVQLNRRCGRPRCSPRRCRLRHAAPMP